MRHAGWLMTSWVLILAGCSFEPLAIAPPASLARIQPLPVKQTGFPPWKAPLSFGAWQTIGFYRSSLELTCKSGFGQKIKSTERFRFTLAAPQAAGYQIHAECETSSGASFKITKRKKYTDSSVSGDYRRLHCTFDGNDSGELTLQGRNFDFETGRVIFNNLSWDLQPVTASSNGIPAGYNTPYGYVVLDGGSAIAAVQTVIDDRVWLETSTAENDTRLATVLTALLLYEPPKLDPERDCK